MSPVSTFLHVVCFLIYLFFLFFQTFSQIYFPNKFAACVFFCSLCWNGDGWSVWFPECARTSWENCVTVAGTIKSLVLDQNPAFELVSFWSLRYKKKLKTGWQATRFSRQTQINHRSVRTTVDTTAKCDADVKAAVKLWAWSEHSYGTRDFFSLLYSGYHSRKNRCLMWALGLILWWYLTRGEEIKQEKIL